jgi:hypothetical protein
MKAPAEMVRRIDRQKKPTRRNTSWPTYPPKTLEVVPSQIKMRADLHTHPQPVRTDTHSIDARSETAYLSLSGAH